MTLLLKDAINPNLVQTLEGGPALVHCGPFGNIAHGLQLRGRDKLGWRWRHRADGGGFRRDLGARSSSTSSAGSRAEAGSPIIVATVRALKMHGGVKKDQLGRDPAAVQRGCGICGATSAT